MTLHKKKALSNSSPILNNILDNNAITTKLSCCEFDFIIQTRHKSQSLDGEGNEREIAQCREEETAGKEKKIMNNVTEGDALRSRLGRKRLGESR